MNYENQPDGLADTENRRPFEMQELKPFTTLGPARKALDNGGRFYNFFDAADDEVVSRGELAKAAGVFTAGIQAFLYLEMTKQDLGEREQETILSLLNAKLRNEFLKKKPPHITPSQVDKAHKAGEAVIVTGYAREVGTQSQFNGFIFVSLMIGKVMVPMLIPINSLYRVIELFDSEKMDTPCAVVCAPLKKKLDLAGRVQFGGVLKELKSNTNDPPAHPVFLEAIFWMKR
jgi:hypothetical protein